VTVPDIIQRYQDVTGNIGKVSHLNIRGLFDKFVENVYKIVSVYSILLVFAYDTGQYVYDRYCKFLLNMLIR